MSLKTVAVKLTLTELQILDELVMWFDFHSRSDAIRIAIFEAAEKRKLKKELHSQLSLERLAHPIRRRQAASKINYDSRHDAIEKKPRTKKT